VAAKVGQQPKYSPPLRGGECEALTLENLPILIPIDDVSEEANHSHDDNDDNGCLNCQYHKR